MKKYLPKFSPETLSLRTVLALYFIPVTILPAGLLAFYAIQLFEKSAEYSLRQRAVSERDALISELDSVESDLLTRVKSLAAGTDLPSVTHAIKQTTNGKFTLRLYTPQGVLITQAGARPPDLPVPYLPNDALRYLRNHPDRLERSFLETSGFVCIARARIVDKNRKTIAIVEAQRLFGNAWLNELRARRQVDLAIFNPKFTTSSASLALPREMIQSISKLAFQHQLRGSNDPIFAELGDSRYAVFLHELSGAQGHLKSWGLVAIFMSMTEVDRTTEQVQWTLLVLTVFFILVSMLLVFFFSRRLVKPIELLVNAMKRVKSGRAEQIPKLDTTYEIEYLMRSFNEMARNVVAAKSSLEQKVVELNEANQEIKNAQSQLVQSAKMVSLGQIVAGVAHELNNPIGYIYSNMHHLTGYVAKVREIVDELRRRADRLPESERQEIRDLEKRLEIDFILKDMEELAKSCLDGANRTKDIVLGLRTFSRVEDSTFRPADLHEGIRSTLRLLMPQFRDRIAVHEEFGEIPMVECSLSQLNQVFMNLLSNAAQAIVGKGDLWIRTRVDGDSVVLQVEDSGAGIPKEDLEKVFDPFFTTKRVGEGTGLGLSIVYSIIQKHEGTISVQSDLGKGTRFTIRLPIKRVQSVAS